MERIIPIKIERKGNDNKELSSPSFSSWHLLCDERTPSKPPSGARTLPLPRRNKLRFSQGKREGFKVAALPFGNHDAHIYEDLLFSSGDEDVPPPLPPKKIKRSTSLNCGTNNSLKANDFQSSSKGVDNTYESDIELEENIDGLKNNDKHGRKTDTDIDLESSPLSEKSNSWTQRGNTRELDKLTSE